MSWTWPIFKIEKWRVNVLLFITLVTLIFDLFPFPSLPLSYFFFLLFCFFGSSLLSLRFYFPSSLSPFLIQFISSPSVVFLGSFHFSHWFFFSVYFLPLLFPSSIYFFSFCFSIFSFSLSLFLSFFFLHFSPSFSSPLFSLMTNHNYKLSVFCVLSN